MVTENTEINVEEGQYYALSELNFCGDIGHAILRVTKTKNKTWKDEEELPRLVMLSARTEESVAPILEKVSFFVQTQCCHF